MFLSSPSLLCSFPKRIQLDGNCVKVGDDVYEMKSAVVTTVNNYKYIYLSTLEGCKTPEDVMKGGKNLQLAFSPTLLDKYVEFNAFGHDFDADKDFFQAVFMDVDNVTDVNNQQTFSISNDAPSLATGTISVLDNGDGTYTIKINVANLGNSAARTLDVVYVNGTPKEYSLAVPSNYTVADGKPVDLKSAVLTHDDAEGVYTIYLSAKAGVTTLAGMADADIVVTMPDAFANDNSLHGFSGDETNAKISIKYAGDTYSQATVNGTNSIALGGNAKLSFADGKADVDFTVFSIKKYKGALKGHYEGNVTRL